MALACGACSGKSGEGKMPEMEQTKYDNTVKRLEDLAAEASDAIANGNDQVLENVEDEVAHLSYDFDGEKMDDVAKQKCQVLKDRINDLHEHPEKIAGGVDVGRDKAKGDTACDNTLFSKKRMKLTASERFAYTLNAGDKLTVEIDCDGGVDVSLYDIDRKMCMRQWKFAGSMTDTVTIASSGIYMMEALPDGNEATVSLRVTYTGATKGGHRQVKEQIVECGKGDFLARETETVTASSVFREPKKVCLRANLKAFFSGKSRVVVPVTIPSGSDALLYSLRISGNENTVDSDGKFTDNLNIASNIKLFGMTVFEHRTIAGSVIMYLLGDTRPPREEDAYCNMYVMTSQAEARKFNDSQAADQKTYKYDVDQTQMGTQSCNGQLFPKGNKTLYLGFENERMRYDNYIWLEVALLTHAKKYKRPVYINNL